jgi:hypothetical protein
VEAESEEATAASAALLMGRAVEPEREQLTPDQAQVVLSRLAAFAHAAPDLPVSDRLQALRAAHRGSRPPVPATMALEEAFTVLKGSREAAMRWCDEHPGAMGHWPCAEALEMRGRVRVLKPEPPA